MQSVSGPTATVVQVSPKTHGAAPTITQQNGQHLILGKIATNLNRPVTTTTELSSLQPAHSTNSHAVYPAHYIETIAEQTVYAANGENGPVQYQSYAPIIYAPVSGGQTYYQTASGQVLASAFTGSAVAGSTGASGHTAALGTGHAQLVTHQGTTYLVQGAQLDEDSSTVSHTAKASPITVQWLVENYETAEGVSLPRSTLYFHYLQHCNEHKLEPMNPASFGKLIRSVFFGLRTRRLGTRGNSKYHYYGIRIKPNSSLNHFVEDAGFSLRHYPNYHRQTMEAAAEWKSFANSSVSRLRPSNLGSHSTTTSTTGHGSLHALGTQSGSALHLNSQHVSQTDFSLRSDKPSAPSYLSSTTETALPTGSNMEKLSNTGAVLSPSVITGSQHQHAQFLGEASSALPNLDEICRSSGLPVPGETGMSGLATEIVSTIKSKVKPGASSIDPSFCTDVITFCRLYAVSASYMLDAVVNLDFTAIETVWKAFWRTAEVGDSRLKQSLTQERLYALVSDASVLHFVRLYDHTFYQSLAEVLIPNVLRPIPHTLTQAIRNFAKSLEGWMRQATQGLDDTLITLKISAVSALAQTLRRYTSLNHLAQAARTVLKNPNQINQMLTDLNKVDFNNVQEQASWVCQCSDATVSQLEQDFKRILRKHASLEEWAQWLDTVVTGILQPLEGNSLAYTRAAHQLILKWSFYSSMVIRDLTLRSAASFGSFHLIRLLFDEYIFYLVEHKVAAHLGMTPVAVMGEMGRHVTQQQYGQARPHTDLLSRREYKSSQACAPEDFDELGFNQDEGSLVNDSYLSLSVSHRPKSSNDLNVDDDDEEVDEYLDDEDDVDDSTGDESTMLKHAHASVQAYCRITSGPAKTVEPSLLDPAVQLPDVQAEVRDTTPSVFPSASHLVETLESDATSVVNERGSVSPSHEREPDFSDQRSTDDVVSGSISLDAHSTQLGASCSPPPILTTPNPIRKVVRVTTFCDSHQQAVDDNSVEIPRTLPSLNVSDQSNVAIGNAKGDISESCHIKRIKLS